MIYLKDLNATQIALVKSIWPTAISADAGYWRYLVVTNFSIRDGGSSAGFGRYRDR
jgi:hypothetical protein